MSFNVPSPGEGFVPAYQVSSIPYVTSSTVTLGQIKQISFGNVTRFITFSNTGQASQVIAFAFTENAFKVANSNYFILSGAKDYTADIRTDRIYVSGVTPGSFTVVAGLTSIPVSNFLTITGSNGYLGVG
jgi:hypothetical protein